MASDEFASYTYAAASRITGITQNLWASKTVTQTYTEANPISYSDPLGLRMMSGIRDWIYGPSGLPFLPGSGRNQQALSDRFEPAPALTSPVMTFPGNPITTIIEIITTTAAVATQAVVGVCNPKSYEKGCEALRDSILETCSSLTGRKQMACFAAAETSYQQCLSQK